MSLKYLNGDIMKKKIYAIFFIITLIGVSTSVFAWREVKKAKEFMAAGMYPQAISLLEKRVNEKPTDVEGHYQLGICYINTGDYSDANARFSSAVKLEPDYGYKIGEEWKKAGDEALNAGRDNQASGLYAKAIKYQPNLKNGIVQKAFKGC